MKYTLEQRLDIGREIYSRSITVNEAAIKYAINNYTAREYMRFYRDKNNLPPLNQNDPIEISKKQEKKKDQVVDYNDLESMTKDELIDEVIKAIINTERAKKGYIVKGDGQEKEFISLNNQNLK